MDKRIKAFDTIKVCRDTYKLKYEELTEQHNSMLHEIKDNYKGKMLQAQTTAENQRHADALEQARSEARTFVTDEIEQLRSDEIARASRLPDARIQILKVLMDVPMTTSELGALRSKFGNDYWTEKMFSHMAAKNGIQQEIKPELDDKLGILASAEQAINDYIDNYSGADSTYTTLTAISDGQIIDWEQEYTSGYNNVEMTSRQRAERVATLVLSESDVVSSGFRLKNMISDMDDWTKTQFLEIFEEKGGNSDILAWAGLSQDMKNYKADVAEPLKKAREIAAKACKCDDKTDAAACLDTVPADCRSLAAAILAEAIQTTDNFMLAEGCRLSEIPEFQQIAEPQRIANN